MQRIGRLMCTVGVATWMATSSVGCGGLDVDRPAPYRVLEANDHEVTVSEGRPCRIGHVTVAVREQPRVLRYELARRSTDGEGETSLTIRDITDGSWSWVRVDEERSVASIVSAGGRTDVSVNPDGSVTVNGTTFDDSSVAVDAVIASPAVARLSAEMLAAADYTLDSTTAERNTPPTNAQGLWDKLSRGIKNIIKRVLRRGVRIERSF